NAHQGRWFTATWRRSNLTRAFERRKVMSPHRRWTILGVGVLSLWLGIQSAFGQPSQTSPKAAPKNWVPPRNPDGTPDLQGIWSNATVTPLERPRELAEKPNLTREELRQRSKE